MPAPAQDLAEPTAPAPSAVLITGATSGLGLHCARRLAQDRDLTVLLTARDPDRGAATARDITRETGNPNVEVVDADLASLDSVRAVAAHIVARGGPPLRAIVCNAGVQVVTADRTSADGYELTFAVNHLAHFLLVRLLLDSPIAPRRVVVVSSGTHSGTLRGGMGFPGPQWRDPRLLARADGGSGAVAYSTSKLANLYFAYELARRLAPRDTTVNAIDPGLMPGTGLARDRGRLQQTAYRAAGPALRVLPLVTTPAASGASLARLAVDPALDGVSGRYFELDRQGRSSTASHDRDRARGLWTVSEALVGRPR